MKHGDKAKSKKASKASGKKGSKAVGKSAAKSSKAKKQTASKKIDKQSSRSGNNGKPRSRISPDSITFTNPVVANAFKRAVKKYPNAFRRLTD